MSSRIYGLDVMRAIAIMMVVFSHVSSIFFDSNHIIINVFELVGLHGVEVFFVLSGFLIGTILLKILSKGGFSIKDMFGFWIRRWFRTLPLYFLILILNITLLYYTRNDFPDNLWQFSVFLQNFCTSHPVFFPEAWSLSVEEYAYIFSPIIIGINYKVFKARRNSFLLSILFLIVVFTLTKVLYFFEHLNEPLSIIEWDNNLKEVLIYRLDAIYYGFIVAYMHFYYTNWLKNNRYKLFVLGVILLLFNHLMFMVISMQEGQSFYIDVLFLPINSITICLFLSFLYYLKFPSYIIQNIVYKISVYSYAIYLLHFTFVLGLMDLIIPIEELSLFQKIVYVTIYIGVTLFSSSMVYTYFEKPMTNLRDHKFFKS